MRKRFPVPETERLHDVHGRQAIASGRLSGRARTVHVKRQQRAPDGVQAGRVNGTDQGNTGRRNPRLQMQSHGGSRGHARFWRQRLRRTVGRIPRCAMRWIARHLCVAPWRRSLSCAEVGVEGALTARQCGARAGSLRICLPTGRRWQSSWWQLKRPARPRAGKFVSAPTSPVPRSTVMASKCRTRKAGLSRLKTPRLS